MKNIKIWFLVCFISTLVGLPISGISAEVLASQDTLSNSSHIRTLAASCAACHGSNGNALAGSAVLAGMDGAYFVKQMLAFKDGSRPATVMHRHAKGLNIDEINLLAIYFSQQKPVPSQAPKSQILSPGHD
jgi:cytochrome subunit of sulfide dehydrogenase